MLATLRLWMFWLPMSYLGLLGLSYLDAAFSLTGQAEANWGFYVFVGLRSLTFGVFPFFPVFVLLFVGLLLDWRTLSAWSERRRR